MVPQSDGCAALSDQAEEWRVIPGLDGYEASSLGRIRSMDVMTEHVRKIGPHFRFRRGRIRQVHLAPAGYPQVGICHGRDCVTGKKIRCNFAVHRLVCLAFHGEPPTELHEVAHNNGVRSDNRPENLRWASRSENFSDKLIHGTHARGTRNPSVKLTDEKVREIRQMITDGVGTTNIAKQFGVAKGSIEHIRTRRNWGHVL